MINFPEPSTAYTILTSGPFDEAACDLPQLFAVVTQHDRMRHSRKDDQFTVSIRQFRKEANEIFFSCDAVVLTTHQENGGMHFQRVDHGKTLRHVQVCACRNAVAERKFDVCESFGY